VDDRARIVVGVDGSGSARGRRWSSLAEAARDAELEMMSVVPTLEHWPVGFGMAAYSAAMPKLVASALLGSVGMHCVLHAPCPITIVRPAPHPAEEQSPPDTSSP
jgi:hypothetical protein